MEQKNNQLISFGALLALAGYILSGPLGLATVLLWHPQPAWTSVPVFVEHYHFIQIVPYLFGFPLVSGMLMLVAGHYRSAGEQHKNLSLLALVLSAAFAALIFFNYIVQTTFVHNLVLHY